MTEKAPLTEERLAEIEANLNKVRQMNALESRSRAPDSRIQQDLAAFVRAKLAAFVREHAEEIAGLATVTSEESAHWMIRASLFVGPANDVPDLLAWVRRLRAELLETATDRYENGDMRCRVCETVSENFEHRHADGCLLSGLPPPAPRS